MRWIRGYERSNLRGDISAGITIGAMLVPQAMAYALLAGLPPQVGLYAATLPVIVYALLGTSRQLAVGPVAIVSLLTASALGAVADADSPKYLAAAAMLGLLVGAVHLILGAARLGWLVTFLSHSVLVGFTAAAAAIIGISQIKHLLGVAIPRSDHLHQTLGDLWNAAPAAHLPTLVVAGASIVTLITIKRFVPRLPGALVVVAGSTAASALFDLAGQGVRTVGEIPAGLPSFAFPVVDVALVGDLAPTAIVITLIGFVESIAVAKVYARRHRYEIDPNAELIALGSANVVAGFTGAYPVGGGFARTAVNDSAGATTPLASLITAVLVIGVLIFLTPLFELLPQAALAAIIVVAVRNLIDIAEMRHILHVKPSDGVGMGIAASATLVLGIEIGIGVAVIASMLVVFARMSRPHSAILGRIPNTTSYRNVRRFSNAEVTENVLVLRIDAAMSFVNAQHIKRLLVDHATDVPAPHDIVLDCSGINDMDATGAEALVEAIDELERVGVRLHLCDVKGPVRDVLHRSGTWARLHQRIHATPHAAMAVIHGEPSPIDHTAMGIDEPRIGS
jgi:SulP family sulfate permease